MDGYGFTGLILLFTALAWMGNDLLKARRPKRGLHDREVRHVTLLTRMRNAAAILMLCTMSVFLFAYSGMSRTTTESVEYEVRNHLGDFTAGMSFALFILTIVLVVLSRQASNHLELSVRRDSIRARIQKFKADRASKLSRS
jgi:hypothetical protein